MYDIVIIDTGVVEASEEIKGYSLKCKKGKFYIKYGEVNDEIGHGTIVYNIIRKNLPSSNILIFKIFDGSKHVTEDMLIFVLKYIKKNIHCKLINMSLGLKYCKKIVEFDRICNEIISSGTIIVSAFDNDMCFSYPALFGQVIGVDSNEKIKKYMSMNM